MRRPGSTRPLVLLLLLGVVPARSIESPQNHAAWWVDTFGVVDPEDDAQVKRAHEVFRRVRGVADKRGSRYPRLLVLRARAEPFAVALPDGSVILTRAGLTLCFEGVDRRWGDSRLAFVLGHELGHLARDDFWHAFAFAALRQALPGEHSPVENLVREDARTAQAKELQADYAGIVYMTLAGYRPQAVLGRTGSFLETWVARTSAEAGDTHHPKPSQRAALVRAELRLMAASLDFFHFGTRLLQLGRYEDAVGLLEHFRDRFPGRSVYSNLGLAHYRLGQQALVDCGGHREVTRFMLPVRVDSRTLARRVRIRGLGPCRSALRVRRAFEEAERVLRHAVEKDATYRPAALNLAATFIMRGEPSRGLGVIEDALKSAPNDPDALNVKAVALYLYGVYARIDTAGAALEILDGVRGRHPHDVASAYNLAAILQERRRGRSAREAWRRFLALEPRGLFAAAARRVLQVEPVERKAVGGPEAREAGPLPLGSLSPATRRRLEPLTRSPFDLGGLRGAFYVGGSLRVLELHDALEIVEQELARPMSAARILERLGTPLFEDATEGGGRLLRYEGVAYDVRDGQAVRRVFF